MTKEHIIYQTAFFSNIEDYKDGYEECLEINGLTRDEFSLEEYFYDDHETWAGDEQMNLDKKLDNNIVVLASLGLWDGVRTGYKMLGNNLNEVIGYFGCDEVKIYFDGKNIKGTGFHHDGSNDFLFRELRDDVDTGRFLEKVYNNDIDINDLRQVGRYTRPLTQVREIYGW